VVYHIQASSDITLLSEAVITGKITGKNQEAGTGSRKGASKLP
jgi:hypothetical protein